MTTCAPLGLMTSLKLLDVRYTRFKGTEFLSKLPNLVHFDCNGTLEQETTGISGKRGGRLMRCEVGARDYLDDEYDGYGGDPVHRMFGFFGANISSSYYEYE